MESDVPVNLTQEIIYRLKWRAKSYYPGTHATRTWGGSADFRCYTHFLDYPDPRRIDIRASARQVPSTIMVRQYHERSAIHVYAILDLSSSMRFEGVAAKRLLAAEIATAIARSATRTGDRFGLMACDQHLRHDISIQLTTRPSVANEVWQRLSNQSIWRKAIQADGLAEVTRHLSRKRSLIFLISDFHFDLTATTRLLDSLAIHDVVPVVLWSRAEYANLPNFGWGRMRDLESGNDQTLLFRPGLITRITAQFDAARQRLEQSCLKHGARRPFFVEDHFDAALFNRHLLGG